MWDLPRPGLEPVSPALAGGFLTAAAPPGKSQQADSFFFFFFKEDVESRSLLIYLFLLCCVFVSVRGLSLVVASGDHSSLQCAGLSLSGPLLLWSTGSSRAGSVVVAHRSS